MSKKKMSLAQKVNVLRASVMGANDGIISIAGIVIGVAAATSNARSILIAGLSGTLAGMISMCMGAVAHHFEIRREVLLAHVLLGN